MSFRDCMISAAEQGAITREEASALSDRFDDLYAQSRLSLDDDAARDAAKQRLELELRAEAMEKKRRILLTDTRRADLASRARNHTAMNGDKDVLGAFLDVFESFGTSGETSIRGRFNAIVSMAHADLADALNVFRRTRPLGRRMNRMLADDVMRELHGEVTGKPEAREFATSLTNVAEHLRQRFNAAGGAIPKLEQWGWTHVHDPLALIRAGYDNWKADILPRLDMAKMRDPLTGLALTEKRLEQVLQATWNNVVTDGRWQRDPSAPAGRGMLANQRAEHRLLVFRTAQDWIDYDKAFGSGDPVKSWFSHINGMARDISLMEHLGPNPGAMVEWMKAVVEQETAKSALGQPSLARPQKPGQAALDAIDWGPRRLDAVYNETRGAQSHSGMAMAFGDVRNTIVSAVLGSGSLVAAATDPFIDSAARRLSGLPQWGALTAILKTFSGSTREEAVRAGILMDDFMHIMGDQARYAGSLQGREWSKWLADRTMTWSGLSPMTQARKHVFALEYMGALADQRETPWDRIDPQFRRWMEGYGIDQTDWALMQAVEPHVPKPGSAGILRPSDIAEAANSPALPKLQQILGLTDQDEATARDMAAAGARRTAEKVIEMILGQTERAVPSGTLRARSFLTDSSVGGTVPGEIARSVLMFKGFGLSFTTLQIQAMASELNTGGKLKGAAYAGSLAIGLTFAGGVAIWLRDLANGREPTPASPQFAMAAMQTGGGFGLFGDFMFADQNRHGYSLTETLAGPVLNVIGDTMKLTTKQAQAAALDGQSNATGEAIRFARRWTPVASSLWYVRAAWNRVVLDQIQYLTDPEAHRKWRMQERRQINERGAGFYWPPGQLAPTRAPSMPGVSGN
jgi:hypothetical protein